MSAFEPRPSTTAPKDRDRIQDYLNNQREDQLSRAQDARVTRIELRRKARDRALRHLDELAESIPAPVPAAPTPSIPSPRLPPGYLQDHEGNITFMGTAPQAFRLLTQDPPTPQSEELGLLGLRMYYSRLALGRLEVLAVPAYDLVEALHKVVARRGAGLEAACVVLGLLASKHVTFVCEMQDKVLPTLSTMIRAQGQAPPHLRVAALVVFENVAQHHPDLVGPYESMLEFALALDEPGIEGKEGEAEVRQHAACALRYLCLPIEECARSMETDALLAYEKNHLPRLFRTTISTIRNDPDPEVRGYALSALERLIGGRRSLMTRLIQEGEGLELIASQLLPPEQWAVFKPPPHSLPLSRPPPPLPLSLPSSIPLAWRLVVDVLGVFKEIVYASKVFVAAAMPYLPVLWVLAQTKPGFAPQVFEIFHLVAREVDVEPSTALFLTLFPSPSSIPAVLTFIETYAKAYGAYTLALVWRRITEEQKMALMPCASILMGAVKDVQATEMGIREVCVWTLVSMAEGEIRAGRKTPERSVFFGAVRATQLDVFLEEYVVEAVDFKIKTRSTRLLALIKRARGEEVEPEDEGKDAFAF